MIPRKESRSLSRDVLASSPAFREAALRSEVRRACAVIGVVLVVVLLVILPETRSDIDKRLVIVASIGLGVLVALQICVLGLARWAAKVERSIPVSFEVVTVVLESLVPTGMMLSHIVNGTLAPYAALSTPPILAYGLMITLTTLRLRPWMCILAGASAAAGYAGLLLYVTYGLEIVAPATGLPRTMYVTMSALILVSGVAAAWVAREIRGHAEAALGEAETRREMARIEQDLSIARSIQQALVPRAAPVIPGFEIAGWNRPADQTGGDYYDWQSAPDGKWFVTLADVSGHGIGPAMVTAACRAYMRAMTSYHGELGALASRINQLLSADLPDGRFITMVSVQIDPARGSLSLLSAGHGPIVHYARVTGTVNDIAAQDPPLAVLPDASFGPAQHIEMKPGDVLALVTDGFVEWARHDRAGQREEFGLARLRESLVRHANLSPTAMIEAITAEVAAFAGAERQQDDLTMVIIRRGEP